MKQYYIVIVFAGRNKGLFFRFANKAAADNLAVSLRKAGKSVKVYDSTAFWSFKRRG